MTVRSSEQRQITERHEEIFRCAAGLVLELGYNGFNIGRLAEAMELSRGAIYQHFSSKEDLLAEIGIRHLTKRLELIERGSMFKGAARERMVAVGVGLEICMRLYPQESKVLEILRTYAALDKASHDVQARMRTCQCRILCILLGVVRDAIAGDELAIPPHATPESLCFGMWVLSIGGYGTLLGNLTLPDMGLDDVFRTVTRNCHLLADGYGWKPLSSECDYEAVEERVRQSIFPAESRAVYG
ncbi:MAG: TetR/AcrR family transcriptional regulator [Candidatus Hydrogenedentes bacterium]|nr:TetR/AcrR family transcriptional regulator [Candidatus Hydrogenedentota bacterium]